MNENLFVDDLRLPPHAEGWDLARSSNAALAMLQGHDYKVVSLDHDLGQFSNEELRTITDEEASMGVDTTRPIVMHWCENGGWPEWIFIHSSNPVGVEWLKGMCERYAPEGTFVEVVKAS